MAMKFTRLIRSAPILVIVLAVLSPSAIADTTTADGFLAEIRTAIAEKSAPKLNALRAPAEASESADAEHKHFEEVLFGEKIEDVSLQPLPPDFMPVKVLLGQRLEFDHPPAGDVKVKAKGTQVVTPYAIIGGHYFLVSPKSVDIGWTGPADRYFSVRVGGKGQNDVQIRVKWNASGVSQEMTHPGCATLYVLGQYLDEVDVTSNKDDSDIQVTITDDDRKETIFTSQRLSGKGTIRFRKNG